MIKSPFLLSTGMFTPSSCQDCETPAETWVDLTALASDWLWETDAEGLYRYVSPCVAEKLGCPPQDLIGRSRLDLDAGNPRNAGLAGHLHLVERRQPFRDFVCVLSVPGRGAQVVRFNGVPVFDGGGVFQGYQGLAANITRQIEAEERAQNAERRLMDALESISDGFALYDAEDRLLLCNRHYRQMFPCADGVIQAGRTFSDIVRAVARQGGYHYSGPELETFVARRLAEHIRANGQPVLHHLAADRWSMTREFRTRNGGVVTVRTDVSEITRSREELSRLQKTYERLLASAGQGIFGIDADEIITYANPMAGTLLGFSREDLVGMNYHELMSDAATACPLPALPALPNRQSALEGRFLRADGSAFYAEAVLTPLIEDGRPQGAVLVFHDVSLRKRYEEGIANHQRELEKLVEERTSTLSREIDQRARTEEALRKSTGRLIGIASTLVEGVLLTDLNGHILFANRSAQRLLGDENRPLAGTDLDESMRIEDSGSPRSFADGPLQRTADGGEAAIIEDAVFVTADGRRLSMAYAAAPLEEEGKRRGVVISFRSIETLKQAQFEALQASRLASVGQLAAGIAHEINTPIQYVGDNLRFISDSLTSIAETLDRLRTLVNGEAAPPALRADVERLFADNDLGYLLEELPQAAAQSLDGVAHVAHIVRSMKDFSHPGGAGKVSTDINHAIDSTITVSRNEWKHQAEIETVLAPDLPHIPCLPAEINQVLLNLITNAAHAIESEKSGTLGRITISTRAIEDGIEIRVADNGPGVPAAIRDKIFDPFFTTKPVGKGTGQGLSICLDVIAHKHGGKLFLEDVTPKGACFVIQLPFSQPGVPNG